MSSRVTSVTVLLGAALALGGCGDVNKGSAKAADFERALTAQHGDVLDDVSSSADNVLPWSGSFHATVTVRPDATAQTLTEVEDAVAALLEGSGDTASLRANGLEICTAGDRRAQHLALREELRAQSRSLLGRLDCDTYAGDLADVAADIAVVQSALASAGAARDLPVDGRISAPRGELDGLWRDLTPHLAQALGALDASDLNTFALDGSALELSVQPGVDPVAVRTAVAAVAPDVAVTVRTGGAHPEDMAPPTFAGPLRTELGALPGVVSARFVSSSLVVVRVASAADVAPTVRAAVARSAAHGSVRLHVTTQGSDHPLWTVDRGADFEAGSDLGADLSADLADFAALVADPGIGSVGWREPGGSGARRQVTISAPAGGDLRTVLPVVKRHVPVGSGLNLHLGDDDYSLDVAHRLEQADGRSRELPATFVDTWNALP
ncbi:hypothetical protein [Knoellia aerolata]|uniref:Uncharacterized protein n=1 Tax=Knoellia aerolata DSM 18566 TaxID=1385519 RepID=A0A0A0JT06_9MICO|nr:hypothetical protein [Knoellia aerolata]KGN40510.1 hypothetical protein N801_13315 [Knoellia aerolata DSM 18566]